MAEKGKAKAAPEGDGIAEIKKELAELREELKSAKKGADQQVVDALVMRITELENKAAEEKKKEVPLPGGGSLKLPNQPEPAQPKPAPPAKEKKPEPEPDHPNNEGGNYLYD